MPKLRVRIEDRWFDVEVDDLDGNPVRVRVDGETVDVEIDAGETREALAAAAPRSPAQAPSPGPSAVKTFRSPMPGAIISVSVKEGDQVVTGDEVCLLESMKMRQSLRADWSGIVKAVHVKAGDQVPHGHPIVDLE